MVAWQCLRGFAKHSNEPAIFQMLLDRIQWEIGEPKSVERGIQDQGDGVEDKRAVDAYPHLTPVLNESPSVQAARGR